ncbi:MAG: hypothetical protein AB8C46_19525 [Burkholderiaceae bacterium]
MLFSQYILSRLTLLDNATKGFGDQIQERSLYEQLMETTEDAAEAVQLIKWGLTMRFLIARSSSPSGGFSIDRSVISPWRSRSNGESTLFNTAPAVDQNSSAPSQPRK